MDGDRLVLNLKMDAGDMVFRPAQVVAGLDITPDQVSLNPGAVAGSYRVFDVAETPYDASMPPGPVGMPEHLLVTFDGERPVNVQPGVPAMYILPVNAYRAQWLAAGNDSVARTIDGHLSAHRDAVRHRDHRRRARAALRANARRRQ